MRDVGIASGREPDVRRDEGGRVINLTFRGTSDARSSVDRDANPNRSASRPSGMALVPPWRASDRPREAPGETWSRRLSRESFLTKPRQVNLEAEASVLSLARFGSACGLLSVSGGLHPTPVRLSTPPALSSAAALRPLRVDPARLALDQARTDSSARVTHLTYTAVKR
jgi:hypothetical protein